MFRGKQDRKDVNLRRVMPCILNRHMSGQLPTSELGVECVKLPRAYLLYSFYGFIWFVMRRCLFLLWLKRRERARSLDTFSRMIA